VPSPNGRLRLFGKYVKCRQRLNAEIESKLKSQPGFANAGLAGEEVYPALDELSDAVAKPGQLIG
jgi:hypothetical protein